MRKGMTGLAMLVQQGLAADPFDGAVFAFRGRRAGLIKLLWHDGIGLCMLTKRLEQGQFVSYGLCQTLWSRVAFHPLDGRWHQLMHTIRMGENAGCSRRSLRLLCGGWLPHDDGASEGCLALATDVGVAACPI